MSEPIRIDSHVRVPRPKYQIEAEREQQRLFKAYKRAYMSVHVREPVLRYVTDSGYFVIDVLQNAVNAKRLKELTKMLRKRFQESL